MPAQGKYKHFRPTSFLEFNIAYRYNPSALNFLTCIKCSCEFKESNTHSIAGWKETQISGFCEDCYDDIFAEDKENEDA